MKCIDIDVRKTKSLYTDICRGSSTAGIEFGSIGSGGTKDYTKLKNLPSINDVILIGNKTSDDLGIISKAELSDILAAMEIYTPKIYVDTTENWNSQPTIRTEEKTIYIYSDYQTTSDGKTVAGIKIGDGDAYLIDMPFIDTIPMSHISDTDIHITAEEREFWNNKVRCYYSLEQEDTLVFTTQ